MNIWAKDIITVIKTRIQFEQILFQETQSSKISMSPIVKQFVLNSFNKYIDF
jgi:hypothetical protein